MRASSSIWDFTEREEDVASGQRRPLLVLDEQTIHLSHTDKKLDSYELLERVQAIIQAYEVPIKVEREIARWQNDPGEERPRIVSWLEGHTHKDYKMILGVDYMGRWASIKMYLAVEPPVLPPTPTPKPPPRFMPIVPIILAIIGVFTLPIVIGIGFLFWAFTAWKSAKQKYDEETVGAKLRYQQEVEDQRAEIEAQAQMKNLFRTYKIDDMRLFSSAMNVVFQAVVDDIVQKDGAKIERIEGGKGGYISEEGVTRLEGAPRVSNAKDLGM